MTLANNGYLLLATTTNSSYSNYSAFQIGSQSNGAIIQLQGSSGQDGAHVRLNCTSGTPGDLTIETRMNINLYMKANQSGGVYLSPGATSWAAISDERKKENLVPIANAITKISSLRAVTGNYIADPDKKSKAFLIAQDVQAVLPEAVDTSDPDVLGLAYTDVIPLLVASIKELSAKVTALEAKVGV